jgi:hypothetical protein
MGVNKKPVYAIIGSGPSLSKDQISSIKTFKHSAIIDFLIVVNDNYKLFKEEADILYAADLEWWQLNYSDIKKTNFSGRLMMPYRERHKTFLNTHSDIDTISCINLLGLSDRTKETEKDRIHCNGNSGAQAINLAFIQGAKTILLFGFDMRVENETNKEHWFGSHPKELRSPVSQFEKWIEKFPKIVQDAKKSGTEIVNLSCKDSGLKDVVPYISIDDIHHFLSE